MALSFIHYNYLYFLVVGFVSSLIFWGISTPAGEVTYANSWFLCISAMAEAGLNPINLSKINTAQQIVLFVLTMIGSPILVSVGMLCVRKRAFEKHFRQVAEQKRALLQLLTQDNGDVLKVGTDEAIPSKQYTVNCTQQAANSNTPDESGAQNTIHGEFAARFTIRQGSSTDACYSCSEDPTSASLNDEAETSMGMVGTAGKRPSLVKTNSGPFNLPAEPGTRLSRYVDRINEYWGDSRFYDLSEAERREIGGVEYDAICLLCWVVPVYLVVWQVLGAVALGSWFATSFVDPSRENGLNPFWSGAFFAISGFNNSGMALLDLNAIAFQDRYFPLLTLSLLILAGNTCYPPFLRLIVWTSKKCIPRDGSPSSQKTRRTLSFILDNPRKVYTHIFASAPTWWLVCTLFILNGIDWVAVEVLSIGNPYIEVIPPRYRVLDGLFQAFAVRIGGFSVVNISNLRQSLIVLYILMMYVSVFPVSMTIRNTNIYLESPLGIMAEDPRCLLEQITGFPTHWQELKNTLLSLLNTILGNLSYDAAPPRPPPMPGSPPWRQLSNPFPFLRSQITSQLSRDLVPISIAILIIAIIETDHFAEDPITYATINIIFEVVSAYGTVGISTGVPWDLYSFCGGWRNGSKIVLALIMLRGRVRGLPVWIDGAVLLPGHKESNVFDGKIGGDIEEGVINRVEVGTSGKQPIYQ